MPESPPLTTSPRDTWSSTERPKRRRRRGILVVAIALVVLLVAAGAAATGYYRWCQGASGEQTPVTFTIPSGSSGSQIVGALHDQGVIRCDAVATYVVKNRGLSSSFEAGEYHLHKNMTLDDAIAGLSKGPVLRTVDFTVPEGWRVTQISAAAQKDLGIPANQFEAQATSGKYSLPPYLPAGKKTVEGFLFPKTYTFARDSVNSDVVIQRQLDQFKTETQNLPWSNAKSLGVTPYQVVTIASMIERETAVPSERPLIAAVIYNRLNRGEILGIDATVEYIDPNPADGLTESDLAIKSPYNTRLYKGLPPTPIASPSLASVRAALSPAKTDDAYYVACGSGGHHKFTASYTEFLKLKQQCLG